MFWEKCGLQQYLRNSTLLTLFSSSFQRDRCHVVYLQSARHFKTQLVYRELGEIGYCIASYHLKNLVTKRATLKLKCVHRVKMQQKASTEVLSLEKNQQKEKFIGSLYSIHEINIKYIVRCCTKKDIKYPLYTNSIVLEQGWRLNLPTSCHIRR